MKIESVTSGIRVYRSWVPKKLIWPLQKWLMINLPDHPIRLKSGFLALVDILFYKEKSLTAEDMERLSLIADRLKSKLEND